MRLKHFTALATLPLLLAACGSPDTESMLDGLKQSGKSASQARCYTDALADALDTDAFNQVAAYLTQGESYNEAIKRARRKYGADFREQLSKAEDALAACDR